MQEYTEFTGMSPIELIEETEGEIEARINSSKTTAKWEYIWRKDFWQDESKRKPVTV